MFIYLGIIIGPLFGQAIANVYGYKAVYDSLALLNLIFVSTYFGAVIIREAYPN
jgi:hypothetical protein